LWCASAGVDAAPPAEPAAREVIDRFTSALTAEDSGLLRAVLPRRGSVQLRLDRLGPENGSFTSAQVEALFRDVFDRTTVRSVETLRIEHEPHGLAFARARLRLTDRDGREASVELRLGLRDEDGRWVLREIRESPA